MSCDNSMNLKANNAQVLKNPLNGANSDRDRVTGESTDSSASGTVSASDFILYGDDDPYEYDDDIIIATKSNGAVNPDDALDDELIHEGKIGSFKIRHRLIIGNLHHSLIFL